MPTFRILDQRPVYFDLAGNLANGGSLKFYETGTTTPKDVYATPDKSVNNGSTVAIGADGRSMVDIWGYGSYRVRLYNADGTLIDEADNVGIPGGTGTTIPALVSGYFLTNDGAVLSWAQIRQLPDPTGSADKVLSTDGENFIWVAKPSDGSAGTNAAVKVDAKNVTIGDGSGTQDKFVIQSGSGTITAGGSTTAQKDVTFPTAFKSLMAVVAVVTNNGVTSVQFTPSMAVLNKSLTGFTAYAQVSAYQGGSNHDANIINDVTFDWIAFGAIAATTPPPVIGV